MTPYPGLAVKHAGSLRSKLTLAVGLAGITVHLLVALVIIFTTFRFISQRRQRELIHRWSLVVLRIFGISVRVSGAPLESRRGTMLVLNHISWSDIYVVHAIRPARFVAKSEIRSWPLIGYLCDRTGTLFIERGRRHAVHQVVQQIVLVLESGGLVGIFPEGTTSDGTGLLPFHANLIQAAIDAGAPVQPVALRYQKPRGGIALEAAYIGDMTLFDSIRAVLLGAPIIARATLLPCIETGGMTRHQVAEAARIAIATSLGVGTGDRQPATGADLQGELL